MSQHDEPAIRIRTACRKRWEELVGDERRRFCSECALHVHNAAELTRSEAHELVADSPGRVCMRLVFDEAGAPVFRPTRAQRLARWVLAAGTALIAACQGEAPAPAPAPAEPPSKLGKVAARQELGDVALPTPPAPPAEAPGK